VEQSQYSRLNGILIASAPIESGFVLAFALLLFGWKWPRYGLLIFAPACCSSRSAGRRSDADSRILSIPWRADGCLYLALLALIVAQSVLKRQDVASFIFGCAVTIVLTCWIHDLLSVLQIAPTGASSSRVCPIRPCWSRSAPADLAICPRAHQVDGFAGRMVILVREAEDKLKPASPGRRSARAPRRSRWSARD